MKIAQILALAALTGSIPIGHIVLRLKTGASPTQALLTAGYLKRKVGPLGTAVVALLILAKGYVAVTFARASFDSPWVAAAAGVLVIVSDCFPYWLMFRRSGSGLVAALGTLAGLSLPAALSAAVVWGAVLAASRRGSIASITAAITAPVWLKVFGGNNTYIWYALAGCAFVIILHSSNISRLLDGTEPPLWGDGSVKGRSGGKEV